MMESLFTSDAFAQIPGQMAMPTDTTLEGLRWGTMRNQAKFHLTVDHGETTLCGYMEHISQAFLAAEHLPWARSEGMVCKRCESRA